MEDGCYILYHCLDMQKIMESQYVAGTTDPKDFLRTDIDSVIVRDILFLYENQIPFEVLEILYYNLVPRKDNGALPWLKLLMAEWVHVQLERRNYIRGVKLEEEELQNFKHLLELVHMIITKSVDTNYWHQSLDGGLQSSSSISQDRITRWHSACNRTKFQNWNSSVMHSNFINTRRTRPRHQTTLARTRRCCSPGAVVADAAHPLPRLAACCRRRHAQASPDLLRLRRLSSATHTSSVRFTVHRVCDLSPDGSRARQWPKPRRVHPPPQCRSYPDPLAARPRSVKVQFVPHPLERDLPTSASRFAGIWLRSPQLRRAPS